MTKKKAPIADALDGDETAMIKAMAGDIAAYARMLALVASDDPGPANHRALILLLEHVVPELEARADTIFQQATLVEQALEARIDLIGKLKS